MLVPLNVHTRLKMKVAKKGEILMKKFNKFENVIKSIRTFLLVLTGVSLLTLNTCYAKKELINVADKVESTARQLLKDISEKRYESILSIIPDNGLRDADSWISKKSIENEIVESNSYLREQLYSTPSDRDLKDCKEAGSYPVSPSYFYMKNNKNYTVKVRKPTGKGRLYHVSFFQKQSKAECRLILFSPSFIIIENKVFLYSYFFNF